MLEAVIVLEIVKLVPAPRLLMVLVGIGSGVSMFVSKALSAERYQRRVIAVASPSPALVMSADKVMVAERGAVVLLALRVATRSGTVTTTSLASEQLLAGSLSSETGSTQAK